MTGSKIFELRVVISLINDSLIAETTQEEVLELAGYLNGAEGPVDYMRFDDTHEQMVGAVRKQVPKAHDLARLINGTKPDKGRYIKMMDLAGKSQRLVPMEVEVPA